MGTKMNQEARRQDDAKNKLVKRNKPVTAKPVTRYLPAWLKAIHKLRIVFCFVSTIAKKFKGCF